jgi:lipopolysaccharide/colanic/teichoic acid biosynthesis glycosyltransferase
MACMTARAELPNPWSSRSTLLDTGATHEAARRTVNVIVALVGIVVTLPLMLAIAAAIALTSPGPIFFRQVRIGINRRGNYHGLGVHGRQRDWGGQPFTMWKFRTMRVQRNVAQVWARKEDSRVTPIGRVLRKLRLDELPQLFNVLRGDMNVVGPRPEQPEIFDHLRHEVPAYVARQRVLPGITGWAQINQRYDASIEDVRRKLSFDLEYIRRCSALEDVRIMVRTFPVMIGARLGW